MTDVVARQAARRAGASFYGVLQPDDLRWHLPSTAVDPAHSPALRRFLDHVDVAIAVHGYGRPDAWTSILLGGQNRPLAAHLARHLAPALDGYRVVHELAEIPVELRGLHPDNPVNLPRQGGVQVELPPRVRGIGPYWERVDADAGSTTPEGVLRPHTEALIAGLALAARRWGQGIADEVTR
jgi:phage replication-related protein YjqB (UPF0714/DUF867 family)